MESTTSTCDLKESAQLCLSRLLQIISLGGHVREEVLLSVEQAAKLESLEHS